MVAKIPRVFSITVCLLRLVSSFTNSLALSSFLKETMSSKKALIIVDMSVEQVSDVSYQRESVIANIRKLTASTEKELDLLIDSRMWLTHPSDSSLSWVWEETAQTLFVADSEGASLIPELRPENSHQPLTFVRKYNYSCFAGEQCQLLPLLRSNHITHVYICGINTDY